MTRSPVMPRIASFYAKDSELRIAIGHELMNIVADGVTDPSRLRPLTSEKRSILSLRSGQRRSAETWDEFQ
jgi:hypothetical protein